MSPPSSAGRPVGEATLAGGQEGVIPNLAAIVMAAGLGKRMRSKLAKVLHPVAGRPLILYAVDLARRVAGRGVTVVIGHQGDRVRAILEGCVSSNGRPRPVRLVDQGEPLGTGHAIMQARRALAGAGEGDAPAYLIMNGDTPLLDERTVRELVQAHARDGAAVTMLTAVLDDPSGYGRVVRRPETGAVVSIVEDRDASREEKRLREVNVGTYLVEGRFLMEALDRLEPKNAQGEYYLTDVVALAVERGLGVCAVPVAQPEEGVGINSRSQLASVERVLRRRIAERWMDAGVTLHDPETIRIDADVVIGADTVIFPFVTLEGNSRIGEDCVIRSHVRITDCDLGDSVVVQDGCVLHQSMLEGGAKVGPFAHLRPGAVVRRNAKVGNFVEMKQAELGEGSKANHLTYLGDATIGRRVNIGAGTVTCNYDGFRKHRTVIEDDVFIGSDALLVAPVTVGRGALIAAGCIVTEDVPADALAIGRARQVNRPGWAAKRRAMQQETGAGASRKAASGLTRKKDSKVKARRHKKKKSRRSA